VKIQSLQQRLVSCTDKEISDQIYANAVDSLRHALSHLEIAHADPGNYKYCYLHLGHAIELLLKSLLALKSRFLLLREPDKNPEITVDVVQACQRLENLCGIRLTREEIEKVKALRRIRNEIEHFAFEAQAVESREPLEWMISFAIAFSQHHLQRNVCTNLPDNLKRLAVSCDGNYDQALREAMKQMEAAKLQLSEASRSLTSEGRCGLCWERTVLIDEHNHKAKCFHCAKEYTVFICSECGQVQFTEDSNAISRGICGLCLWKYTSLPSTVLKPQGLM
jgi:hypothetical protein